MYREKKPRIFILSLLVLTLSAVGAFAQADARMPVSTGLRPVLWEAPEGERDLYLGPGGAEMQPDLSKIKFVKEDTNGHNKKYEIKDAAGRTWIAKLGSEAQPETAAVRILYGLGYKTEINYLAPKITIPGKGTFENVRLEARPDNVKRLEEWKWKENPFVGSNELQGLKVMMVFLTNWDLLDLQNKIIQVTNDDGSVQRQYIISDLGATFGKLGNNNLPFFFRLGRKTNDPGTWYESGFISGVNKDGTIDFDFKGKGRDLMNDITIDQGRWIGERLDTLSDKQLTDAFRAAGYSNDDVSLLKDGFKARVAELEKATGGGAEVKQ